LTGICAGSSDWHAALYWLQFIQCLSRISSYDWSVRTKNTIVQAGGCVTGLSSQFNNQRRRFTSNQSAVTLDIQAETNGGEREKSQLAIESASIILSLLHFLINLSFVLAILFTPGAFRTE
jgi:hypothetical protein